MLEEIVIEIFSTEMGVSSYCFDCKNTIGNGKERNIEGSSSKIEDENVLFLGGLGIETVCDCRCGRFVDDSKDM